MGASVGVVQDAVVDWGHLKADVVQYGGGTRKYDILPGAEEAGGEERRAPPSRPPPSRVQAQGGGQERGSQAPLPPRLVNYLLHKGKHVGSMRYCIVSVCVSLRAAIKRA